MAYEVQIGDAVVSGHLQDAGREDARDRKAARMFPPSAAEAPDEVAAFCAALSGLPSLDYAVVRGLLPLLPLPRGSGHFRLFLPGCDTPFHRTRRVADSAAELTSRSVLYAVLSSPCAEVTSWTTTIRRPTAIPGVLDLEIDAVMREARRPMRLRE